MDGQNRMYFPTLITGASQHARGFRELVGRVVTAVFRIPYSWESPLFVGWQTIHILIKSDEKHKLMHLRAHQLCTEFEPVT